MVFFFPFDENVSVMVWNGYIYIKNPLEGVIFQSYRNPDLNRTFPYFVFDVSGNAFST